MEKMCRIANVHQESGVKTDSSDQIVGRCESSYTDEKKCVVL